MAGPSPRLHQRVCEILASEIASGALSAGTYLTETNLAERFGISRAPARHALGKLELRGLMQRVPGRGYQILSPESGAAPAAPSGYPAGSDEKIHFLSSWELIYRQIEIEIVSRTSLASWRINEAALAAAHGVSRTVARDVMARLQQRGVVLKDDAGRWLAPGLTPIHVGQLYELRWVLEPLALEQAFPHLPDGYVTGCIEFVEQAIAAAETVTGDMLDRVEHQLHSELLGYCDNRALMQAISLPQAILVAHHFLYQPKTTGYDGEPFLLEHLDVLAPLASGDIGAACDALERHLRISRDRAIARIGAAASRNIALPDLPYLERQGHVKTD